jgi:hypothetical protein
MSTKDEKIAVARRLIQFSNEHNVDEIFNQNNMVVESESASNPSHNQKHESFNDIKTGFSKFMNEIAPDVQWEIKGNEFKIDENFSGANKQGDAVLFSFQRESKGEWRDWQGMGLCK